MQCGEVHFVVFFCDAQCAGRVVGHDDYKPLAVTTTLARQICSVQRGRIDALWYVIVSRTVAESRTHADQLRTR